MRLFRKSPNPKKKTLDCEKLWRPIHCDNCKKVTQHIYCHLKYRPGYGYGCFECGQEREK